MENTYWLVLAFSLLTTPPDVPLPLYDDKDIPQLCEALTQAALTLEILDTRETRYVFNRSNFEDDLVMLQQRYVELRDAPRIADCARFPGMVLVNSLLTFNREFSNHITNTAFLHTDMAFVKMVSRENDYLYRVWDAVRDAQCDYYYIIPRRRGLLTLKKLIGEQDYYMGILPPHVPFWYFAEK